MHKGVVLFWDILAFNIVIGVSTLPVLCMGWQWQYLVAHKVLTF